MDRRPMKSDSMKLMQRSQHNTENCYYADVAVRILRHLLMSCDLVTLVR